MDDQAKQSSVAEKDDLSVEYANNVFFEPTIWDLKLIFGEWSARANAVDWHTSITIPWAQAKLIQYYLTINIEAHEQIQGKISLPASVLPPEPDKPDLTDDTGAQKDFYDMVVRNRNRFIDSLK
jgi:hypothetical protein